MRPWKAGGGGGVGPVSHISLIILKNIPEINMANIPKTQNALYPDIPKIDPSISYPFKYSKNIPYPF